MMTLLALLVIPGVVVGLAARLPLRMAVATSIPVSYGVAAIAGYVYGRLDVAWSLGGYAIATAVTALVVGAVGLLITGTLWAGRRRSRPDRKSTRLNSSHVSSSYAVFCLNHNTR